MRGRKREIEEIQRVGYRPPGATVDATEEAIINALVAARTMTGINGNTIYALPHDQLRTALQKYGRLNAR